MSKKAKVHPPTLFQKGPYASVSLEVRTWHKDSQGLFDFEQKENTRFKCDNFKIANNCKIFCHVSSMKTIIELEGQRKDLPMEYIYICSICFNPLTNEVLIQSADATGVKPHSYLYQQHPDIFRNSLLVVADLRKDFSIEGYPLEAGKIIRLGRIEYLVIEVLDQSGLKMVKQTSHLQLNKDVYKITSQIFKGTCKICLCDQATEADPLINPCACKGSCELVHVNCLKNWINSKVKKDLNGIAISYNFSKFECEICKTLLPKAIQKEGAEMELITFEKPQKPYIVIESVTEKHERREELKQRNLHVIFPQENVSVKLGRGHQCEIRITDVSVSRVHSEISYQNGKFYIKDLGSKFGTSIKFREEVRLRDQIRIQYGRTCLKFILNADEKCQPKCQKEMLFLQGFKSRTGLDTRDVDY